MENFEKREESLSEYQRGMLEQVGVGSVEELKETIEELEPNSEEREYFQKVLEQLYE